MKQFFLLLVFAITPVLLYSQNISVKSFRQLPNDLDARVTAPLTDQNGDVCAIIKVVSTQTGFTFEGGQLGIVKTVQKTAETWVYVPYGTKRISISHPLLGMLRDYMFPEPIEKAVVYELVLTTGKVITTVEETIESQWLLITPEPADAMVYLDDQFIKNGTYQSKLKPGSYTYRVEAPLYHSEAGKIVIINAKIELNVKLKPAFGYLSVTSTPEQDAKVLIDGKPQTGTTPFRSDKLSSGEHTVQVVKEMYQPAVQKITIVDGQTQNVSLAMKPNFAELSITAPSDATIFINNQQKTTGNWKGRLNAGVYSVEAQKDKHRPAKQDIEVSAGDSRTIDLQPTAICGSLEVLTTPPSASITINGKNYGYTPNTINKLLIGDYTLILEKQGYGTITKTISIKENLTTELNENLPSGILVTITSVPQGALLTVDGVAAGSTPYTATLGFGNHAIKLVNGKKLVEQNISITQGSKSSFEFDVREIVLLTDTDGNVYKTVTIGSQTWMAENLKTTKYSNGISIPLVTDNTSWSYLSTPGYCWYDNDATANKATYGALYNWYTVNTGKLCPTGWHVPTDAEWTVLLDFLGGWYLAGGKLKEAGFTHWNSPNTSATNEIGFSALPSGSRGFFGEFFDIGNGGNWWSSTETDTNEAWYQDLANNYCRMGRGRYSKREGYSVRCLGDIL